MKNYKGIEFETPRGEVSMAHSRFFGRNANVEYLRTLLGLPKAKLNHRQFEEVSALNSVSNANYQICNGGLCQYFDNGYDAYRKPFNEEDVAHLDKSRQAEMLQELLEFGMTIYPERADDNIKLMKVIEHFKNAEYSEEDCYDEDDEYDEYYAPDFDWFDSLYYEVNFYIELLLETYASYLLKKFEA